MYLHKHVHGVINFRASICVRLPRIENRLLGRDAYVRYLHQNFYLGSRSTTALLNPISSSSTIPTLRLADTPLINCRGGVELNTNRIWLNCDWRSPLSARAWRETWQMTKLDFEGRQVSKAPRKSRIVTPTIRSRLLPEASVLRRNTCTTKFCIYQHDTSPKHPP